MTESIIFPKDLFESAQTLIEVLRPKKLRLVTAESCTGGLLSALLTEIPGASKVFERGYITYNNAAKIDLLTVPTLFVEKYGAVSSETALAMAEGALLASRAQVSIAITGVAGPAIDPLEKSMNEKPVGTVFIASACHLYQTEQKHFFFNGSRSEIRIQAVRAALHMLLQHAF